MNLVDLLIIVVTGLGAFFFFAGTLGVIRFPDTSSRLHALTKADNMGLGLIALGVAVYSAEVATFLKLLLIWLLAMMSSATASYLIAKNIASNNEAVASDTPPGVAK